MNKLLNTSQLWVGIDEIILLYFTPKFYNFWEAKGGD